MACTPSVEKCRSCKNRCGKLAVEWIVKGHNQVSTQPTTAQLMAQREQGASKVGRIKV